LRNTIPWKVKREDLMGRKKLCILLDRLSQRSVSTERKKCCASEIANKEESV
jgi:hypothetical protein